MAATMKRWVGKLVSADDAEVSVLHVVLVFAVLMFAIPVAIVIAAAGGYALAHGWKLMPGFGGAIKDLADAYACVTGSTGIAWALKGGGQALGSLGAHPDQS